MQPRYCRNKETTLDMFLTTDEAKMDWKSITKKRPSDEELTDYYKKYLSIMPGSVEDYIPFLIRNFRLRCGEKQEEPEEDFLKKQIAQIEKREKFKYSAVLDKTWTIDKKEEHESRRARKVVTKDHVEFK